MRRTRPLRIRCSSMARAASASTSKRAVKSASGARPRLARYSRTSTRIIGSLRSGGGDRPPPRPALAGYAKRQQGGGEQQQDGANPRRRAHGIAVEGAGLEGDDGGAVAEAGGPQRGEHRPAGPRLAIDGGDRRDARHVE